MTSFDLRAVVEIPTAALHYEDGARTRWSSRRGMGRAKSFDRSIGPAKNPSHTTKPRGNKAGNSNSNSNSNISYNNNKNSYTTTTNNNKNHKAAMKIPGTPRTVHCCSDEEIEDEDPFLVFEQEEDSGSDAPAPRSEASPPRASVSALPASSGASCTSSVSSFSRHTQAHTRGRGKSNSERFFASDHSSGFYEAPRAARTRKQIRRLYGTTASSSAASVATEASSSSSRSLRSIARVRDAWQSLVSPDFSFGGPLGLGRSAQSPLLPYKSGSRRYKDETRGQRIYYSLGDDDGGGGDTRGACAAGRGVPSLPSLAPEPFAPPKAAEAGAVHRFSEEASPLGSPSRSLPGRASRPAAPPRGPDYGDSDSDDDDDEDDPCHGDHPGAGTFDFAIGRGEC